MMKNMTIRHVTALSILFGLMTMMSLPVQAEDSLSRKTKSALKNTVVKQAAIGAAAGALGGALSRETSAVKGAGIGALTGAGTGLIDSSRSLDNKPLIKTAAKGAVVGTGASAVMGRSKLKGAAVGAGAGAAAHYVRKWVNNDR